jgi:hypothetical protein
VRFGHGKLRATDRDQQTVFVTTVRLLGYWRLELPEDDPADNEALAAALGLSGATAVAAIAEWARDDERFRDEMLQWPDATMLVDPNWREDERRRVGEYLQRGTRVNQMRGISLCRFCERNNGTAELTDGVYCWPEGLAHYVSEHDVRLPEEFVGHALSQPPVPPGLPQPSFDELGQRDRSWPGPSFAHLLWAPEGPRSDGHPLIKADPSWWLQVTGMQGNA